jgi:tripartite-type tricarboxylate transporter receptor subunit TctC
MMRFRFSGLRGLSLLGVLSTAWCHHAKARHLPNKPSAFIVSSPVVVRMLSPYLLKNLGKFLVCLLAVFFNSNISLAQNYPSKTIRLVLPFPAGNNYLIGQFLAEKLTESLGQPTIIESKSGAGGSIAVEMVAKSSPDGYTLLVTSPTLTIGPIINSKLKVNPLKDLIPIAIVGSIPNIFVVSPSSPVKSFKEFLDYAKARPGQLSYGTGGIGSSNHFAVELLKITTGIDLLHIPYPSTTAAMTNVVGGQIDLIVGGLPSSVPLIKNGQLRPIAILTQKRSPLLPDVPTIAELGYPELVVDTWYGVLAPAGTKQEIIDKLHREIIQIVKAPDTKERFAKAGIDPVILTRQEFTAFLKNDYEKWLRVKNTAQLKFD